MRWKIRYVNKFILIHLSSASG